ncbi:DUF7848 domain-containing protein [Thermomonospora cellulosilytica]|uniref:DUF7848 domain-containing protein n=1 Tax=Thermomonospora cellulosilytica TaxID=1411118 RepID=A0A7W3RB23_9ACTN|nr:hypothetical protein [Thermomonospora cellulosilytica]MBA9005880.1 hypothetical protein [Thermomonospora cellulosilytica]
MSQQPACLPALPEIDPEESPVTFVMLECRTCGDSSGWMRDRGNSRHYEWAMEHFDNVGHPNVYTWSVSRSTARTGRF